VPLSERTRRAVLRRAGYRCEYCRIVGWELPVEHVTPRSRRRRSGTLSQTVSATPGDPPGDEPGDLDNPDNLASACAHCNRLKGNFTAGRDPVSGRTVRLFHPRRDAWDEHFTWSNNYLRLMPLTEMGGATIARLRMNDPILIRQRRLLRLAMAAGAPPWP
jgi:hypothetical protein